MSKKQKQKQRLKSKFVKYFFYPLTIAILLSVIITIFCMVHFTLHQTSNKTISSTLVKWEGKIQRQLLNQILEIVNFNFLYSIFYLKALKEEYFFQKMLSDDMSNKEKEEFTYKVVINVNDMNKSDISGASKNDTMKIYWYVYNETNHKEDCSINSNNISRLNTTYINSLYESINIILLVNSFELEKSPYFNNNTFIYNPKLNLVLSYSSNSEIVNLIKTNKQKSICNSTESVFYYYNFKYNKEYLSIKDYFLKHPLSEIAFSNAFPTSNQNENNYILTCIKLNDVHDSILCKEIILNSILDMISQVSYRLKGDVYLLKVNSTYPLLNINMNHSLEAQSIDDLVFNIFDLFYIDELIDFKEKVIPKMIRNFEKKNKTSEDNVISEKFMKNNDYFTYNIYPIYLNISSISSITKNTTYLNSQEHIFSIVYIFNDKSYLFEKKKFQKNFYTKLIIKSILISFLTLVLLLVTYFLIDKVARRVLSPIKNLYSILIEMDEMNQFKRKKSKKQAKSSSVFIRQKESSWKKSSLNNTISTEDSQLLDNSEDSFDENSEEDEDIENRSEDTDILFNNLIKIKTTFKYTQQLPSRREIEKNGDLLIKYIISKQVFNEISNLNGRYICDSNIANMCIDYKMYDKAILHLNCSLEDPYNIGNFVMKDKSNSVKKGKKSRFSKGVFHFFKKSKKSFSNLRKSLVNQGQVPKTIANTEKIRKISSQLKVNLNNIKSIEEEVVNENKGRESVVSTILNNSIYNQLIIENDKNFLTEKIRKSFIESRYPKLLFAYKNYFQIVSLLVDNITNTNINIYNPTPNNILPLPKSKNQRLIETINLKFMKDIFSERTITSLRRYEEVIIEYYEICKMYTSKNEIEATLEYIEFLIEYKLRSGEDLNSKINKYMMKNDEGYKISNSLSSNVIILNNPEDLNKKKKNKQEKQEKDRKNEKNEKEKEVILYKKEIVNRILYLLLNIKDKIKEIKDKITNENIRHLLEIRRNKKSEFEMEVPESILVQRYVYLKGLFNYTCNNYEEAVVCFNKSKQIEKICDASIIIKSIEKIQTIVLDEIKFLSMYKDELSDYNDEYTSQLESIYNEISKEKSQFYNKKIKNISILINRYSLRNSKTQEQTIETILNIFTNYMSDNDVLSVLIYDKDVYKYMSSIEKGHNTIDYILDQIKSLYIDIDDENEREYYENHDNFKESYFLLTMSKVIITKQLKNKNNQSRIYIIISNSISREDSVQLKSIKKEKTKGNIDQEWKEEDFSIFFLMLKTSYSIHKQEDIYENDVEIAQEHLDKIKELYKISVCEIIYMNKVYELSYYINDLGNVSNSYEFLYEKYKK